MLMILFVISIIYLLIGIFFAINFWLKNRTENYRVAFKDLVLELIGWLPAILGLIILICTQKDTEDSRYHLDP